MYSPNKSKCTNCYHKNKHDGKRGRVGCPHCELVEINGYSIEEYKRLSKED